MQIGVPTFAIKVFESNVITVHRCIERHFRRTRKVFAIKFLSTGKQIWLTYCPVNYNITLKITFLLRGRFISPRLRLICLCYHRFVQEVEAMWQEFFRRPKQHWAFHLASNSVLHDNFSNALVLKYEISSGNLQFV